MKLLARPVSDKKHLESSYVKAYERHRSGEPVESIAQSLSLTLIETEKLLRKGRRILNIIRLREVNELRIEREHANEKLRTEIQSEFGEGVKDALRFLLQGNNVFLYKDLETGKMKSYTFKDPKIVKQGMEEYIRITSLQEKPAPAAQVAVNVQQNNTVAREGNSMEEVLARIRAGQAGEPVRETQEAEVVDVDATPAEPVEKEASWDF